MRRLLSYFHDNGLSMVLYGGIKKHAAAVVLISCQWSEHGFIWPYKETCGGCCPHLSMILLIPDIKHAPGVVVISWQCSKHGYIWPHIETCGGCGPHFMTMV